MNSMITRLARFLMAASTVLPVQLAHGGVPGARDAAAIQAVLDSYTRSVSTGDVATFETLLLDPRIPFHGLKEGDFSSKSGASLASVQNYADFKRSVFSSGEKLAQRFFDVHIRHEGDLAQVSLRFETLRVATGTGAHGWKTLELLRVNGQWKIASEFYTAYPLTSTAPPTGG